MAMCDHLVEARDCADCRSELRRPVWFEAYQYSICEECQHTIRPGEAVRSDGCGGFLCGACGDTGPGVVTVQVTGGVL